MLRRFGRTLWRKHKWATILGTSGSLLGVWIVERLRLSEQIFSFWHHKHNDIMDLIGVSAFVLAFVGAIVLEWLRRRVSTRYIGRFPRHLSAITRLVRSAAVRIDSLADCVDYGSFFNPQAHERLIQEIIEATLKRDVSVRVLICEGPKPISAASTWEAYSFTDRFASADFRDDLASYLNVLSKEGGAQYDEEHSPGGFAKFLNDADIISHLKACNNNESFGADDQLLLTKLLLRRHDWFRDRLTTYLLKPADIRYQKARSDVFLWIIDGVEALFLFTYKRSNALAFLTRDPALIRVLEEMFEHRWNDASINPPEPPVLPLVKTE